MNFASTSSSPSTSSAALWTYIKAALDILINGKAPAIDVVMYSGIHSACYNYFTAQNEAISTVAASRGKAQTLNGSDIYDNLDRYFQEVCQERSLGAPEDEGALVEYLVSTFDRFTTGAKSTNRLLNYINRHYVKRAVDEDRGWLRLNDVLDSVAKRIVVEGGADRVSNPLKEKRIEELKRFGYSEGDSNDRLVYAEQCLEAASTPDRVVPILSLAHRRFRIEVIEPLLLAPKTKAASKGKHRIPKAAAGPAPYRPKGRLARAVHHVMTAEDIADSERLQLITGLAYALQTVGVRPEHAVRKRIDKYIQQFVSPPPAKTTSAKQGSSGAGKAKRP